MGSRAWGSEQGIMITGNRAGGGVTKGRQRAVPLGLACVSSKAVHLCMMMRFSGGGWAALPCELPCRRVYNSQPGETAFYQNRTVAVRGTRLIFLITIALPAILFLSPTLRGAQDGAQPG